MVKVMLPKTNKNKNIWFQILFALTIAFINFKSISCRNSYLDERERKEDFLSLPSNALEFASHHNNNKKLKHLNKIIESNEDYDERFIEQLINEYLINENKNNKHRKNNDRVFELLENKLFSANNNNNNNNNNKNSFNAKYESSSSKQQEAREKINKNIGAVEEEEVKTEQIKIESVNTGDAPALKGINKNKINGDEINAVKLDRHEQSNFENKLNHNRSNGPIFYMIVIACSVVGSIAIIATGFCWYTLHKNSKATANVDYPAFDSKKSPSKMNTTTSSGDRRLAQSAQMYHYQHQKQQMIAIEKANNDMKQENSDNSEGETEEGDYTVYECPGLAPTGEMEVKNPLFKEDFTPPSSANLANASKLNETLTNQQAPLTPTNNQSNNLDSPPLASVPQSKQ